MSWDTGFGRNRDDLMGLFIALIETTPTGPRAYRVTPVPSESVGAMQLRHRATGGWAALLARIEGSEVTVISTAGLDAAKAGDIALHKELLAMAKPARLVKPIGLRIPRPRARAR